MTIEEVEDLSVRTYNILKRSGINFVSEARQLSSDELMQIKGITN